MAEFKTQEDLEPRARYLVDKLHKHVRVGLTGTNSIELTYTDALVQLVASELLDIYKEGWDDRSIIL